MIRLYLITCEHVFEYLHDSPASLVRSFDKMNKQITICQRFSHLIHREFIANMFNHENYFRTMKIQQSGAQVEH